MKIIDLTIKKKYVIHVLWLNLIRREENTRIIEECWKFVKLHEKKKKYDI